MKKINNDLVRLTTQDVGKAIPITDTSIIAEKFEVKHLSVVKLIEKYKNDIETFGKLTSFEMSRDTQRKSKGYILNEMQFSLLVMYMKNTERARIFKIKFVEAFFFMKNEIQVRKEIRHIGINARKSLTDSIKLNLDENTNFKKFAYSNYSKLVYKKVLGKTVKKAKEEIGLTSKDNIRNHFSIEQLEEVQKIESKIATWIEAWKDLEMSDKEIYAKIKEKLN